MGPMEVKSTLLTPYMDGLWRDARFSPPADGGHPENALSGVMSR